LPIFVIEAKVPLTLATAMSIWAIVYCAAALKRAYAGSWSETPADDTASLTVLASAFS